MLQANPGIHFFIRGRLDGLGDEDESLYQSLLHLPIAAINGILAEKLTGIFLVLLARIDEQAEKRIKANIHNLPSQGRTACLQYCDTQFGNASSATIAAFRLRLRVSFGGN